MRAIIPKVFLLLLLGISFPCSAKSGDEVRELKNEVERTSNDIKEIRRDQLNYKIEKDLLKETYSSNLQTINFGITIVLAVFSIVGFLGIRNIGDLKKEYSEELKKLNDLKDQLVIQMGSIVKEQDETKKKYIEVVKINEAQEIRLRVLELQEKVTKLFTSGNYSRALEYISVGLDISPNDQILLEVKFACLARLNQFVQAIDLGEKLLVNEAIDINTVRNLCELYLVTNNINQYEKIIDRYRSKIDIPDTKAIIPYFETIKYFMQGNLDKMKETILSCLQEAAPGKSPRLKTWEFTELQFMLKTKPPSKELDLLMEFIQFLKGSKDTEELKTFINVH